MKPYTLPVKRTPVSKGILRRLSAVTRSRRQRVAATAMPGDFEEGDQSSKISRALTIIFLIHIVGIGLVFFHRQYLGDDKNSSSSSSSGTVATTVPPVSAGPKLSNGDTIYRVGPGDNYGKIAASYGVEESDLRAANENRDIRAGVALKIPPKRIVAVPSPEVTAMIQNTIPDTNRGLVEAVPVPDAPRAQIIRPAVINVPDEEAPAVTRQTAPRVEAPAVTRQTPPKVDSAPKQTPATKPAASAPKPAERAAAAASGRKYVVKSGDSIYRIAGRFAVDQKVLMKANGISDPKKLKLGMTLTIPQ